MAETANKQLSEETVKEAEIKVVAAKDLQCPFLVRRRDVSNVQPVSDGLFPRISDQVTVDKETLTVSPVVERFNLDAEIQTFKDQCGTELMKTLIAQGRAVPEDFYDDGKSSIDMREIPDTIHDANKAAVASAAVLAEVAKQLGVPEGKAISSDDLVDLLSKRIAANLEAAKTAAAQPKVGE